MEKFGREGGRNVCRKPAARVGLILPSSNLETETPPSDAKRPSFASQVNAASVDTSIQPSAGEEDSDDWLNVDAENLDAMLEQAMAPRKAGDTAVDMEVDRDTISENPEERLASEQANKLKNLAERVEKFVEGEGGLEGALLDGYFIHSIVVGRLLISFQRG